MADPLHKPRGEGDWFGVAIAAELEDGESTVTSRDGETYPQVRILRGGASAAPGYTDVTSEFIEDGETDLQEAYATVETDDGSSVAGVRFRLCEAKADGEQLTGRDYRIQCKFATDRDREPVRTTPAGHLVRLRVT